MRPNSPFELLTQSFPTSEPAQLDVYCRRQRPTQTRGTYLTVDVLVVLGEVGGI